MPHCAVIGANNTLQLTQDAVSACQGVIVLTPEDYDRINSLSQFFVHLNLDQAKQISLAIAGVLAVACVYRVLIRQVEERESNDSI